MTYRNHLKYRYEKYCDNCSINCVAICKGKVKLLIRLNEEAKYSHPKKTYVKTDSGILKLPDWSF